jgi:hypothetical protein
MSADMLAAALEYAKNGVPIFPCKPDKSPRVSGGFKAATVDEAQIRDWWQKWPGALIGMATGKPSGISVLDIDKKNDKDGFKHISDWRDLSPITVVTRSGGAHIYFADDGTIRNGASPEGIDVRGTGGYVIVPPSPGYSFLAGGIGLLKQLPPFPDRWRAFSQHVRSLAPHEAIDPALLLAAAIAIPNPNEGWERWNNIGMAFFNASAGTDVGLAAFDHWSKKSELYDRTTTAERWEHFGKSPPTKIGAGTLIHLAYEADTSWMKRANSANPAPATSLHLFKHGEVPPHPPSWLIKNRLPQTGAGLLVGKWGFYKTFMALDLAWHVMTGTPWTGQPVKRPGGVLLFAAEGAAGMSSRLEGLINGKLRLIGQPAKIWDGEHLPFAWTDACPPLQENSSLEIVLATCQNAKDDFAERFRLPLALIVIDTVSQSAGWKDENDNAEAARVMKILRTISQETGALVLGIDHLGKSAEQGARGASAKEANSDFVLIIDGKKELTGETSDTKVGVRKLRDGPQGDVLPFTALKVDVGLDEDGQTITSRIIDWNAAPKVHARKGSEKSAILHAALNDALRTHGEDIRAPGGMVKAAPRPKVRERFLAQYRPGENLKRPAALERFRKAVFEAAAAGEIGLLESDGDDWLWWVEGEL